MPRVVTGEFRGTVLAAPKGDNTRPTTDKVKEAVFSMIQTRVPDCSFLDIFAGTGQMAIEAVSRGAKEAVMIERAGAAASVIKDNLRKIRCEDDPRLRLIKAPFEKALEMLGEEGGKFDIIYLDPPYRDAHKYTARIADLVRQYGLLGEGGILLAEHASDLPFDTDVINLKFNRSCSYGLTVITFFE